VELKLLVRNSRIQKILTRNPKPKTCTMSYIVLARKYRPQTFSELVGQDQITTTLTNAIVSNRLTHAFLFTGPRGVGKTSTARILAKAINCKEGPTPSPCGKCDMCMEITNGSSLDVIEIDGASNRGIDDIRMLCDGAKFVPIKGKFKIYIIDEVHQITPDAFNALLKTLEEPPGHLKFIFATTEVHKIPLTIVSRCQRFDFRRVKVTETIKTLQDICEKEDVRVDKDALFCIAKSADGSLRDAETLLDQLISYTCSETISKNDVQQLLGLVSEEDCFLYAQAIENKDASMMLDLLKSVSAKGGDIYRFTIDLIGFFRDVLVYRSVGDKKASNVIDLPEDVISQIAVLSQKFTAQELFYIIHVLSDAIGKMKRNTQINLQAEVAALRLVALPRTGTIDEIFRQIQGINHEEKKSINNHAFSSKQKGLRQETPRISPESEQLTHETKGVSDVPLLVDQWPKLLNMVKEKSITVGLNLDKATRHELCGNKFIIGFLPRHMFHKEFVCKKDAVALIEEILSNIYQKPIKVQFSDLDRSGGPSHGKEQPAKPVEKHSAKEILDDPNLKGIINAFDAEVINIER